MHAPAKQAHRLSSTLANPKAWLVMLAVLAVGLALDLGTKALAFRTIAGVPVRVDRRQVLEVGARASLDKLLPPHDPVVVLPRVLEFKLVLNRGAVFGIGAGRRWFFVAFTLAAAAFCLWMFAHWTRPVDRWAHAAIGMVLAGGLGNLYDRLVFACVRDFIHPLPGVRLPWGLEWPWGGRELWSYVSNIADKLLLVGIAILVVHLWRHPVSPSPASPRRSSASPEPNTGTAARHPRPSP
jgi:signal peptidase II